MRIPVMQGVIDRRILANFHVDPEVVDRHLPSPFRPLLVNGYAIAGICLIRLKRVRPRFLPCPFGFRSENAAHRIAVQWESDGKVHQGVYVPRRDTNSRLNSWAGGTLFPGTYHHAKFEVDESDSRVMVAVKSDDGATGIHVSGSIRNELPTSSVFADLAQASQFFANGSLGYSATSDQGRFEGMELRCSTWHVKPLEIDRIESSFFDDPSRFPKGSIDFDCALLMRDIQHQWHSKKDLCCANPGTD